MASKRSRSPPQDESSSSESEIVLPDLKKVKSEPNTAAEVDRLLFGMKPKGKSGPSGSKSTKPRASFDTADTEANHSFNSSTKGKKGGKKGKAVKRSGPSQPSTVTLPASTMVMFPNGVREAKHGKYTSHTVVRGTVAYPNLAALNLMGTWDLSVSQNKGFSITDSSSFADVDTIIRDTFPRFDVLSHDFPLIRNPAFVEGQDEAFRHYPPYVLAMKDTRKIALVQKNPFFTGADIITYTQNRGRNASQKDIILLVSRFQIADRTLALWASEKDGIELAEDSDSDASPTKATKGKGAASSKALFYPDTDDQEDSADNEDDSSEEVLKKHATRSSTGAIKTYGKKTSRLAADESEPIILSDSDEEGYMPFSPLPILNTTTSNVAQLVTSVPAAATASTINTGSGGSNDASTVASGSGLALPPALASALTLEKTRSFTNDQTIQDPWIMAASTAFEFGFR